MQLAQNIGCFVYWKEQGIQCKLNIFLANGKHTYHITRICGLYFWPVFVYDLSILQTGDVLPRDQAFIAQPSIEDHTIDLFFEYFLSILQAGYVLARVEAFIAQHSIERS